MKSFLLSACLVVFLCSVSVAAEVRDGSTGCETVHLSGGSTVVVESYSAAPQKHLLRTELNLSSKSVELPIYEWQQEWKVGLLTHLGRTLARSFENICGVESATICGRDISIESGSQFEWNQIQHRAIAAIEAATSSMVLLPDDSPEAPLAMAAQRHPNSRALTLNANRRLSETQVEIFSSDESRDSEKLERVGKVGTEIVESLLKLQGISTLVVFNYRVSVYAEVPWTNEMQTQVSRVLLNGLNHESWPCLPANQ